LKDLGRFIHDRRVELHLTLEEVGNYVGVGKSTVRKWEAGIIKKIGNDKIDSLASILQVSPLSLIPVSYSETIPYDDALEKLLSSGDDGLKHLDSFVSDYYAYLQKRDEEEKRLVDLYRGANDQARKDAMRTLEEHQVKVSDK